jgi:hypothetical protein
MLPAPPQALKMPLPCCPWVQMLPALPQALKMPHLKLLNQQQRT